MPEATSILPYVYLSLAWGLYFFLHSFLASRRMGSLRNKRTYRIAYNVVAIIGLLALMVYNSAVDGARLFPNTRPVRYVSLVLTTLGVVVIREAFKQFPISGFMGARQEENKLRTGGILQYIRHPLYAGTFLITLSYILFSPTTATLVSSACIFIYLAIGIRIEEKKLLEAFGDEYREYQRKVPMLIPRRRRPSG